MNLPRYTHTATLLKDGRVLVAGGATCSAVLASTELYDPNIGAWNLTGSMTTLRIDHIAVLLNDGRVLVAGGGNGGGSLASAEAYDPNSGIWTPTNSMRTPRAIAMGTLLQDGRVLVIGGLYDSSTYLATAELYDPSTGTWSNTSSMSTPRLAATMTLLADGKVLVTGGIKGNLPGNVLDSAELYDPVTNTWSSAASMSTPRDGHTATLLRDGTILVVGGANTAGLMVVTAEVYDPPPNGIWEPPTNTIGYRYGNTITGLLSGDVLVAGGGIGSTDFTDSLASAELFHR